MTTKTGQCRKCHRKLTDPRSVARGYGPRCFARMAKVAEQHKPAQLEKALELIKFRGVWPCGCGCREFVVIASSGTTTYRTAPTGCTCMAGRFGRTCYHQVAVKLLAA